MARPFFLFLSALCFTLVLSAARCKQAAPPAQADDRVLAVVFNKNLYASQLDGVVPDGTPPADSALLVSAYVRRWITDQLLMYEAERNIPQDIDIDQLVRDYRASLVRFNFEQQLIAENLDSTVSETELRTFYEGNKDQFQLESTILKVQVLKLPLSAPQSELNRLWYSRAPADQARLESFAKQYASLAVLDDKKWYKLEEIAALLPKGTLTSENVGSRREGTVSDSDFRYYYRVFETVKGKETAPFDYVREQASKLILHRRKQDLLERWKQQLYEKELRRENIKIIQ